MQCGGAGARVRRGNHHELAVVVVVVVHEQFVFFPAAVVGRLAASMFQFEDHLGVPLTTTTSEWQQLFALDRTHQPGVAWLRS